MSGGLLSAFGLLMLYNVGSLVWGLSFGDTAVLPDSVVGVAYFAFAAGSGVALAFLGGRMVVRVVSTVWRPSS